ETARRPARIPSGTDDYAREGEALAGASAERLAHVLPAHRPGKLDDRRRVRGGAATGAGDRQPAVAASHGAGPCRHAERLRHARRKANASRIARLARLRIDPQRVAPEADP